MNEIVVTVGHVCLFKSKRKTEGCEDAQQLW